MDVILLCSFMSSRKEFARYAHMFQIMKYFWGRSLFKEHFARCAHYFRRQKCLGSLSFLAPPPHMKNLPTPHPTKSHQMGSKIETKSNTKGATSPSDTDSVLHVARNVVLQTFVCHILLPFLFFWSGNVSCPHHILMWIDALVYEYIDIICLIYLIIEVVKND